MCSNSPKRPQFEELEAFIQSSPNKEGALISILHKAQEIFGYLPREVQQFVADKTGIPIAKVNGVVTFYSYFTENPVGKHVINVCMGTACFVKGSGEVLEEFERRLMVKVGETTPDEKFTLQVLRCVGACGLAPVVTVDNRVYGHFTKDMVVKVLDEYRE